MVCRTMTACVCSAIIEIKSCATARTAKRRLAVAPAVKGGRVTSCHVLSLFTLYSVGVRATEHVYEKSVLDTTLLSVTKKNVDLRNSTRSDLKGVRPIPPSRGYGFV